MDATDKQIKFATDIMEATISGIRKYIDSECVPGAAEDLISKFHVSQENAIFWIDEMKNESRDTELLMDMADKGIRSYYFNGRSKIHGPKRAALIA